MKELEISRQASLLAGEIIRQAMSEQHIVRVKADGSLASNIDDQAEQAIRELINRAFPDYKFLGEEQGESGSKDSEYLWVVDAIDGTHNFLAHVPFCSTSIALFKGEQIICAVINDPLHNELFSAQSGDGTFLNGQRIETSGLTELSEATVGFTRGSQRDDKEELGKIYSTLSQEVRNTRILGSVALHFAYVACGRFDALVNVGNNLWDVAAGVLLVEEAGGKVTWDRKTNQIIACNNSIIHDRIVQIILREGLMNG